MSEAETAGRVWLVLLVRMASEPARHRMAHGVNCVAGAVPLGQAAWAVPDMSILQPVVQRLSELATVGNGQLLVLSARGHGAGDVARLEQLYTESREQEWTEFRGQSPCRRQRPGRPEARFCSRDRRCT